jgi:hypothetical protein
VETFAEIITDIEEVLRGDQRQVEIPKHLDLLVCKRNTVTCRPGEHACYHEPEAAPALTGRSTMPKSRSPGPFRQYPSAQPFEQFTGDRAGGRSFRTRRGIEAYRGGRDSTASPESGSSSGNRKRRSLRRHPAGVAAQLTIIRTGEQQSERAKKDGEEPRLVVSVAKKYVNRACTLT